MTKKSSNDDFFEKFAVKVKDEESDIKEGFFTKMKNDKKYSAKVQLMGYVIFLVLLVIILNSGSSSMKIENENGVDGDLVEDNTSVDNTNLLENLDDNYSYDTLLKVVRESVNVDTEEVVNVVDSISYVGKSYNDILEISKVVNNNKELYYKVGEHYYSMIDNITTLTLETEVYSIVDSKYIEISDIVKLIKKASLDHVTEYSSGKKESVYHLKVKDVVGEFEDSDVVEIKVVEENGILLLNIDYSTLFNVIYESVIECKLEVKITNINKVEEFDVVVSINDEVDSADNDSSVNTSSE